MRLCIILDNGDDKNERIVPSVPRVLSHSRRMTRLLRERIKFNWTICRCGSDLRAVKKEGNASNSE